MGRGWAAVVVLSALFACEADAGDPVYCSPKLGERADLTVPVDAPTRPTVSEPIRCSTLGEAVSFRVRGFGRRRFAEEQASGVCDMPGDYACSFVVRSEFQKAVEAALLKRIPDIDLYASCGRRMAAVRDWRQANDAVAVVDAELERWDLAEAYEIGVESGACFVAE